MHTEHCRESRIEHLREQYDRGVQFHRQEFSEIEAKVKYWLTFLLPASIGLLGYLLKTDAGALGVYFTSTSVATLVILVTVIITFALSLRVASIQAGILRPSRPELGEMDYYTNGKDEHWREYLEAEVSELLRAFENNERANAQKAKWLIRGQTLLFFGVPAAPTLAMVCGNALLYACAHQIGLARWCFPTTSAATTGVCAGATAGVLVAGVLLLTSRHSTS
ncbi:hypothetical protein AB9K35_15800 [Leisingera sp. XS_AS12]|uniref:hypothetical protein n=1 Tax=Leisingera sp. XS_AS12 TaxID=3241294 RepID=UPI0035188730